MKIQKDRKTTASGLELAGMTLVELLIAMLILIIAVSGILISYLRCLELSEVSRNTSLAVKTVASQMEQVAGTSYAQVKTSHNLRTFTIGGITNSRGVIYVDDADPNFLAVAISVSWKQENGRQYGGDKNLNAQIDAGDTVKNGILSYSILDSPVMLVTRIFRR